ncbi:MAG TPA: 4-alpha-glucanotransferase, partial [Thermodesulfobacteriaceae bacterium]|nr:4-alpha-glucanotransferase [Thermodesulfobacteriaceae bacterium]
ENTVPFSEYSVDFVKVVPFKEKLLSKAYERSANLESSEAFHDFRRTSPWLDDYALFMSIKEENGQKSWHQWPEELASRDPSAMKTARTRLSDRIRFHRFVQFIFNVQWQDIRREASERGIKIIGDIPIYVAPDSADVWAHQECFHLDRETLRPVYVAGVPPDYFSSTGQLWGNPIYRWEKDGRLNPALYRWWEDRFRRTAELVDIVRIDHFRGFESFWQVPAGEKNAVNGEWVKGPGSSFFHKLSEAVRDLEIIAEDLGTITTAVEELRDNLGFPGMKILQFAFDSDENNLYLPFNFKTTNCVVYTGTHDNDTTLGWYLDDNVPERAKERARRCANSDGSRIHWDFIRMAFGSVAETAIIPMQDVLGFGNDCRMNHPSTTEGNWTWRCAPRFMSSEIVRRLRDETRFYNRFRQDDA